jgi:imidazole glycerol-phosphate synthase subunit HisH
MKQDLNIGVIDCGGNTGSIMNALKHIGADTSLVPKLVSTTDCRSIKTCDKLILPGQGNFGEVMRRLEPIRRVLIDELNSNKPFLGICVGYQVLFEESEESPGVKGLGVFPGKVIRFRQPAKLPHMGWNMVMPDKTASNTGLFTKTFAYFVHSYYPVAGRKFEQANIAWTTYADRFMSALNVKNISGTQFHPEKSGEEGLSIIRKWLLEEYNEYNTF